MVEQGIMFDYHYEEEAERYAFFRIPKALYTEPMFKETSDGAKVLYGQLLELMSLSRKSGWIDEEGKVFIRCSIDRIKEIMNCSSGKAVKMLMELDIQTGIGLIEKVKQGQGKSTVIYVKSFVIMKESSSKRAANSANQREINKNSNNENSRIPKIRILEFQESECNNTYINNTDFINPYPIHPSDNKTEMDEMDEIRMYTEIIKENICYDALMERSGHGEREDIDEIIELMVEIICVKRKTVKIAGAQYPHELVKGKLLKIDISHIEYVLDSLHKTTTDIRNIKAYLLTTIYNAPNTIKNYYRAAVNHDLYGGGQDD